MTHPVPSDLRYTPTHEWVRRNSDGTVTIGITDHAQRALGELVYVETPRAGRVIDHDESCAVVESVKSASDVYSPLAGTVVAGNYGLAGEPGRVNADPYGEGWLLRLAPADAAAVDALLDAVAYAALIDAQSH